MPRVALGALVAIAIETGIGVALTTTAVRADETDTCIAAAEKSQVERRAGRLGSAREQLVSCSADACPAVIRRDCARWLGEVESATPTVVVRATDAAGEDVRGGDVRLDGAPRPAALEGRAFSLDPGPHKLRIEARGFTVERDFVLREGERERVIAIRLGAPAETLPPRTVPRGAFVLGAAGILTMTVGVGFWGVGSTERGRLVSGCGKSHSCSDAEIDASRSKLVVGDILFGAGIATVAVAVVWGLTSKPGEPKRSVAAEPVPGGAALRFRSTF